MKATGIVRRIDDLGRIVIPKEIRKTLKVKVGMPLEIYTAQNGEIILKKYYPFSGFSSIAKDYAESMAYSTGMAVMITDREKVIASVGCGTPSLEGREITTVLEEILDDRDELIPAEEKNHFIPVVDEMEIMADDLEQIYGLIRNDGEILGAVFLVAKKKERRIEKSDQIIVQLAADFLGRQVNL